jgi:hypothetical protein
VIVPGKNRRLVSVQEFFRRDPLGVELRQRMASALRSVDGVTAWPSTTTRRGSSMALPWERNSPARPRTSWTTWRTACEEHDRRAVSRDQQRYLTATNGQLPAQVGAATTGGYVALQAVLMSLRGTPCGRENGAGVPADAGISLECEPVKAVWRRGPTWKGHALLLRARRSEFRFPTEAPGHPRLSLLGCWESAGDDGTAGDRGRGS